MATTRNLKKTEYKYATILVLFMLVFSSLGFGKQLTINGFVRDSTNGEVLIGANIYLKNNNTGTITNTFGYYSMAIPEQDSVEIIFSYMGFMSLNKQFTAHSGIKYDADLVPQVISLNELIVSAERSNENVVQNQMSTMDVSINTIRKLPAILGETDVLKSIQFLPGVQAGSEGTTGFYVRGGSADQNLVLLDGAVVYNPNHLFGLLSTFNPRAINKVSLIKGGFPAQYGGRLSSSMNIAMKEGNNKEFHGEAGFGLIASRFTLEGPIIKDKASFMVSGRRTTLDMLLKPFSLFKNNSYSFYDLNAKVNFELTDKDRLFISYFKGRDDAAYVFTNSLNYNLKFGNSTGTFRWNHLLGDKLFVNTSLIYNSYLLNLRTIQGNFYAEFYSEIKDVNSKIDFDYFLSAKHNIKFGFNYTNHIFTPTGTSGNVPKDSTVIIVNTGTIQKKYAKEGAVYLNDKYNFSQRIGLNIGVRVPIYKIGNTTYTRVEPRTTLKYILTPQSSIKAAYTIMNQFVHLVPSATASVPTDIWIPSSDIVKPQHSKQIALGYFQNSRDNNYEASIETFYKTMDNQVAFREGTHLIEQTNIDSQLVFGKGESYGAEFFLKKKTGQYSGWISYTLSWTNQQFPELNFGKVFPFKYDRRHNLSVVGIYEMNKKWTLSADFVLTSGNATTLPKGRVNIYGGGGLYNGVFDVYSGRNNYRLNMYNRLDVSATNKHKAHLFGKAYDGELIFSIYNLYNRKNPYFVYFDVDATTNKPFARQVSLLPIIPSITYNLNF